LSIGMEEDHRRRQNEPESFLLRHRAGIAMLTT
jgi:hypothetical protein